MKERASDRARMVAERSATETPGGMRPGPARASHVGAIAAKLQVRHVRDHELHV